MDAFDVEIKIEFINESLMNLEEAEGSFMELESASDTKPLLDKIFRLAHNLKGGSRAVGFGDVAEFTHQLENLVLKIQKGEVTLSPQLITTLLRSNDRLVEMLSELKSNIEAHFDNADILKEIQEWVDGRSVESQESVDFKTLYKSAVDKEYIVAFTDPDGKITYVNEMFCKISGYSEEELIGQDHAILNSGKMGKGFFKEVWATIKNGKVWTGDICNRAKDRSLYWVATSIFPVINADGKIVRFVAIRKDITDKKNVELQLEEQTKRALEATKAKSAFLANMSHEIRTPLNSILGMAELLSETELTYLQKKYVNIFRNAGESLLEIINNILDLSRIEAGQSSIETIEFDLHKLIESVVEIFFYKVNQKNIELRYFISNKIAKTVFGDPLKIKQILINLVGNAVKFTQKGTVDILVTEDPANKNNYLIQVRDSGIGIASNKLEMIFEKFTQEDSSVTKEYGGTGLGLAICKELSIKLGSVLTVSSKVGIGSTFSLSLPYVYTESMHKIDRESLNSQLVNLNFLIINTDSFWTNFIVNLLEEKNNVTIIDYDISNFEITLNKMLTEKKYDGIIGVQDIYNQAERVLSNFDSNENLNIKKPKLFLIPTIFGEVDKIKETKDVKYFSRPVMREQVLHDLELLLNKPVENKKSILIVDDDTDILTCLFLFLKEYDFEIVMLTNGEDALRECRSRTFDLVLADQSIPKVTGMDLLQEIRHISPVTSLMLFSGIINDNMRDYAVKNGLVGVYEKINLLDISREIVSHLSKTNSVGKSKKLNAAENMKVLVVDDNPDNRILLCTFLDKKNIQYVEAESGEVAFETFKNQRFDMVFMDIQMPVMDGYTATQLIRQYEKTENLRHTPIIALSAFALQQDVKKSLSAGCDEHITKPVKRITIDDVLSKYQSNS